MGGGDITKRERGGGREREREGKQEKEERMWAA